MTSAMYGIEIFLKSIDQSIPTPQGPVPETLRGQLKDIDQCI